jgi:hypothetical protein
MDVAASIQAVTEDVVLRIGRELHRQTGRDKLVMAGGVALNCVANGRLLREGPFTDVWIQPAAGDAGGALGAALFVWHQLLERPRTAGGRDSQKGSLLGPSYSSESVRQFLEKEGAAYEYFPDEDALLDHVAQALAEEKVVGWLHGRMEFGPRALGARSILGDARSPHIQATMNLKIKFRESFRPFAPVVLREHVHEWFRMRPDEDSPYMLLVAPVLEERRVPLAPEQEECLRSDPDLLRRVNVVRSQVPAVTHVDYSARVQTVDERHGRFHRLLKKFHEKTGCPVLVNTSFNLSWEPIVQSPQEAYNTFLGSEMDVLVLEDCVLRKEKAPPSPKGPPARVRPARAGGGSLVDPLLPDAGPALSDRLLRQFAALWVVFCGAFAWTSYVRGHVAAAVLFAALAAVGGPLGLVRPQAIRPVYVGLTAVTSPVGRVVSRVFLGVLYYGLFTPLGLALRLAGRDVLCRRKRPGQTSWWTPKDIPADVKSYFCQS